METEWLILADYATMVNEKLYLQGGGWYTLTVNSGFPATHAIGIAASFAVPWNETNQKHNVEIDIVTEDGQSLAKIEGGIEVGRPPGIPMGQEQRAQIAGSMVLQIPKPGTYSIIASVEGQESRRISFNVVPGPMLAVKQQPQATPPPENGG